MNYNVLSPCEKLTSGQRGSAPRVSELCKTIGLFAGFKDIGSCVGGN